MPTVEALTTTEFDRIAVIAKERWGLSLTAAKKQLVTSRLSAFLRKSSFADVNAYLRHLEHEADEKDMLVFFDLLSTNVTSFFRDRAHFDYLERELFTALARGNITLPQRRLRMWSAGCSTGCEPYTMAMVAHDSMQNLDGWDVQILATDLSNYAVQEARAGVYEKDNVKDLPKDILARHFDQREGGWAVKPHLRSMVRVGQLNLMDPWSMKGPFDVIFCRNVMIYFDAPTQRRVLERIHAVMKPHGLLFVGHSENFTDSKDLFRLRGKTIYERV